MNRYTKDEILGAVREELIEANKALGISDNFTDKDYTFIGVVAASIERLDSKAELLSLKDESKQPQPPDFANTTLGEVPQVVSVENQEPQQAVEGATPVVRQNEQTKELCLRCHAKEVSISGELWCDSCFRKNLKAQ